VAKTRLLADSFEARLLLLLLRLVILSSPRGAFY
jgi:hypothetical protein